MLREKATNQQNEYEIVLLEELVPEDHLLRKIDKAVEQELLFRMLLLGYLYGESHRRPSWCRR